MEIWLLCVVIRATIDKKTIIMIRSKLTLMHVKCPKCDAIAELDDGFAYVKCEECSLDVTYGEYVKMIAYKDPRYRNVLNDYK